MTERFTVAIVGSGPAGLSAGARAAALGMPHVVLEREPRFAETIQRYQKGKLVMATPEILPRRSDLGFEEGSREAVLATWEREIAEQRVNIRYGAAVAKISGKKGGFEIALADRSTLAADHVVLAIGVQGTLRRLEVPGDAPPMVQYQLDDPDAFADETIVVVGGGDSAIENALALARQNQVIVVYRQKEFARLKEGNLTALEKAIRAGRIRTMLETRPRRVEPGGIELDTKEGIQLLPCDRVIARLGGIAPRGFLEACGVRFPADEKIVIPEVSPAYETDVPGLYAIGALAGYPLIKHCLNQGYEVIQTIAGQPVEPADEDLLKEKLLGIPGRPTVGAALELIKSKVKLFDGLTTLQLREFLLDSETHVLLRGQTLPRRKDYGDNLLLVVEGTIEVELLDEAGRGGEPRRLVCGEGEFFGDVGYIAARRRSASVRAKTDAVLIELARRAAMKLLASVPAARRLFQATMILRQLQDDLAPDLTEADLADLLQDAKVVELKPGDPLLTEGERDGKGVFFLRTGSVTVTRKVEGKDKILAFLPAGRFVGEMAILREGPRTATVTAAIRTEAIEIGREPFRALLKRRRDLEERIERVARERELAAVRGERDQRTSGVVGLFEQHGVTEATDVLLIDESLCIRCDNCEKACAESHDGISRLDREAGPTLLVRNAMVHVPTSCRHCEMPHCMKECPPNAIHRAETGEVWIDDTCIGCGYCVDNCPYGVIKLAAKPAERFSLLGWLLAGRGPGPGESGKGKKPAADVAGEKKKAVKCDACKGIDGGPACVRACPTGAAIRIAPGEFLDALAGRG